MPLRQRGRLRHTLEGSAAPTLLMPQNFLKKYLPTPDSIRAHHFLSRFGRLLHHPNLWCLNRRSVAGGVAVGLFSGLVPGPLQMISAVLLAVPLRVNLPVALLTTVYTNPLTIGPLYLIAYKLGRLFVPGNGLPNPVPEWDWSSIGASAQAFMAWLLSLGKPLAVGLPLLALLLAFVGYFVVQLAWRVRVTRAWQRRKSRSARSRAGKGAGSA
jgi:uncharacterized protein (DUF2062 family)